MSAPFATLLERERVEMIIVVSRLKGVTLHITVSVGKRERGKARVSVAV